MSRKKRHQDIMPDIIEGIPNPDKLMFMLFMTGTTPDDYKAFFNKTRNAAEKAEEGDMSDLMNIMIPFMTEDDDMSEDVQYTENEGASPFKDLAPRHWNNNRGIETNPIADAKLKTLRLNIKLENVKTPPMWREVEVPADMSFYDLNQVIQTVMGFEDAHLWQFTKRPYDHEYIIADSKFVDDATNEAKELCISSVLAKKGDKTTYTYDFGDDWNFKIEVKEIKDRTDEVPKLIKWKSDLNCIEDSGGPYNYELIRLFADTNGKKLTKKQREEVAEILTGDTDVKYALECVAEYKIDPEEVSDMLANL